MAFEATHVRFARDLAGRLNVSDRLAYFCGAIYPDTRYASGVTRELTHEGDVPLNMFAPHLSDFEKGWATHLYYDEHAGGRLSAMVLASDREFLWYATTALKYIEDSHSLKVLGDDTRVFEELRYNHAPKGESIERMNTFLDTQRAFYAAGADRVALKQLLSLPDDQAAITARFVELYLQDPEIVTGICQIYPLVFRQALEE